MLINNKLQHLAHVRKFSEAIFKTGLYRLSCYKLLRYMLNCSDILAVIIWPSVLHCQPQVQLSLAGRRFWSLPWVGPPGPEPGVRLFPDGPSLESKPLAPERAASLLSPLLILLSCCWTAGGKEMVDFSQTLLHEMTGDNNLKFKIIFELINVWNECV